jgi:predicted deacylase
MDHLTSRAQRLIEEFEEGKDTRHGIANVLWQLTNAWDSASTDGTLHGVRCSTLEELASELIAPDLYERALAGDKAAALQFLQEAGFIDENGHPTDRALHTIPQLLNRQRYD